VPILLGGGWQQLESPGFAARSFAASGTPELLRLAVQGFAGQVVLGARPSGGPVSWQATSADDAWQPAPGTDLVWAEPTAGSAWLFATGLDGSVRALAADERIWRPVGMGAASGTIAASRLAATCRTAGQIELFADTANHALSWTWWS
jgi:hypothetical protein